MSEKRFTYGETIDYNFFDVFEEKKYLGMIQRDSTKIVARLNEQQATIEQQEQSITILKQEIADTQVILEMLSEKLKGWNNE